MRYAHIPGQNRDQVEPYLPANYTIYRVDQNAQGIIIAGEDSHGWTLDDYVIPRLGSGLIFCEEVWPVFVNGEEEVRCDCSPKKED